MVIYDIVLIVDVKDRGSIEQIYQQEIAFNDLKEELFYVSFNVKDDYMAGTGVFAHQWIDSAGIKKEFEVPP